MTHLSNLALVGLMPMTVVAACGCSVASEFDQDVEAHSESTAEVTQAWGADWKGVTLAPGTSSSWIEYWPWTSGDHWITYCNDADHYKAGQMHMSWSKAGSNTWSWWATVNVYNHCYDQTLWSGTPDIGYRFIFYAAKDNDENVTFHYHF
jgi:hypothetical protein